MFTYDCLVAAVLLTTPVDTTELVPHLELIQPAFLQLAMDIEVLDPREDQYLQGLSRDPVGDWKVLRARYDVLLSAPRVAEADRLPDRKLVEEFLAFNRAYRKDLLARMLVNPLQGEELGTALNEVDRRYQVWSAVRDARCGFYYVTVRRQSMADLRDLVGAESFYRAELPAHVPIWHFPRLK